MSLPENRRGLLTGVKKVKIWVDLDNTPHVPFFVPVIRSLERAGFQVVLTARDAFQVCELASKKGLNYKKIGRHYGRNPILKLVGLVWRSTQLLPFFLRHRPGLALSHGARSQVLLCKVFGVPTVLITDYEHGRAAPLAYPKWLIVPEALRGFRFPIKPERVRYFRGIKEDVYVRDIDLRAPIADELGLSPGETVVTIRPPASEAHYHNAESEMLLTELMERLCRTPGVRAVLLPRTKTEEARFRRDHPDWFQGNRTVVPKSAVDGLGLIWSSDLVVSGGGTMNREAAALGVPVYSLFRGKPAAVDMQLELSGRLTMIETAEDVRTKIPFRIRERTGSPNLDERPALSDIVSQIEDILCREGLLKPPAASRSS